MSVIATYFCFLSSLANAAGPNFNRRCLDPSGAGKARSTLGSLAVGSMYASLGPFG